MYTDIEKAILDKLLSHGYVGKKHTPEDNVPKGFPKHLYNDVRKALKRLIRDGLVLQYPTSHGMDVTLNKELISEIKKILGFK
ncbi:MAG: hypothetical protein QMC78_02065 [Methanocellales archaeon]|nr:hypothetical protein [Methanocellales archaeon]